MRYLAEIDIQLLKWAYQRAFNNSLFVKILIFIGDGPFWLIILFLSALAGKLSGIESFNQLAVMLMTGLLISNVVFFLCKTRIRRRRPYANAELQKTLQMTIQNRDPGHGAKELESFPSGHVLWTTLCVSLICVQFGYISILLIGWLIPVMMFLRPYLGVHYPSDVLASLVLGSVNAGVSVLISGYLMKLIDSFKDHPVYIYGYWVFIIIFLFVGFKSWLKRV